MQPLGDKSGLVVRALLPDAAKVEIQPTHEKDKPRSRAIEQLLWFVQRLPPAEIELVRDVCSAVLKHTRDTPSG